MPCVCIYGSKGCVLQHEDVSFLFEGDLKEIKKKKLTLKLRINYFLLIQSFLACLIVYIYIHV